MNTLTNLHSIEPKDEILPKLHKDEDAILEPISPAKIINFHTEIGWNVNWNESYATLVGQIQMQQASLKTERDSVIP